MSTRMTVYPEFADLTSQMFSGRDFSDDTANCTSLQTVSIFYTQGFVICDTQSLKRTWQKYINMEFIELILINKLDGVVLKYPHHDNLDGTICITGHHLILSSRKEDVRELWLLHKNIDSIEKKENRPVNGITQGGSLFLKCKDLKIYQLDINSSTELSLLAQTLENLSGIHDPCLFYPFFYRHMHPIVENGYILYSIEGEFTKVLASEEWRISRVNNRYTVCGSYGKSVVVPKNIDDDTLVASAGFRQGGRFPVLSYRHTNGAVLLRAGQPLYGPKHRRCRQDENILNSIVGVGMKGVIYDLRSSNSITQQQNKGGGTESNANYSQWKIYNRSMDDVDNQEQLLSSFSKLIDACNDREISVDKWISKLDSSGWPESVRNALHTACIIAQHIHQKAEPVLIHGTKGEDATLLICSLVQIILNPDCRTIRGFQALIEREWLQAGHPFSSRMRSGAYSPHPRAAPAFPLLLDCVDSSWSFSYLSNWSYYLNVPRLCGNYCSSFQALIEREWLQAGHPFSSRMRSGAYSPHPRAAPTFPLLLDCVRQFLEQFPCSFEYCQCFLVMLFEHSYSSQFGTFLCDNDKEREVLGVYKQTTSLWSWVNQPDELRNYINPLYDPTPNVIWPSVAPMSFVLWEELYLRWLVNQRKEQLEEQYLKIKTKEQQLRTQAQQLRRELFDLAQQYYQPDNVKTDKLNDK